MNYENYKQFFDGGFFPIDSDHKLVNLANTGEFEVTATTGSGVSVYITDAPGAQSIYNWAQQYADKFDSIEIS